MPLAVELVDAEGRLVHSLSRADGAGRRLRRRQPSRGDDAIGPNFAPGSKNGWRAKAYPSVSS
jgi:hypothetical protein